MGILSVYRSIPPLGWACDESAVVGRNEIERLNGSVERLGSKAEALMNGLFSQSRLLVVVLE
jgi:hypothetical protein